MKCSSDRLLDVSIVKDPRAFAVLEEEWEDLHRNSPLATPFQSWAWLYSWWDFYGEDYELRLVTMRDDTGLLVGLAPLMLERRGGVGRLLFLGAGLAGAGSPYDHDLLARRGWETKVSAAGRRTLEQMDGWHVVDLQQ